MRLARILILPAILTGIPHAQTSAPGEVRIRAGSYAPPGATIAVQANLVELATTIRDRKGQPAGGFTVSDFELLDNGKPQKITFFSEVKASHVPEGNPRGDPKDPAGVNIPAGVQPPEQAPSRYLALFFDDTHAESYGLQKSRLAAEKLIVTGLRSGDHVAVFTDSGAMTVEFTADKKALLAALAKLKPHSDRGAHGLDLCPTMTPYQAYVIAQHLDPVAKEISVVEALPCRCPDGDEPCVRNLPTVVQDVANTIWQALRYQSTNALDVLQIVVRDLAKQPGARILVMISPGFVTGGMEQQRSAILDTALRGHIVVNSLDVEGLLGGGEAPETLGSRGGARYNWTERSHALRQSVLTELMADSSAATGGRLVRNTNDLMGALETLAGAPEVSYLMGFAPADKPDGSYHTLKLKLRAKDGYEIDTRAGYFAALPGKQDKKQDKKTEGVQQRIDVEALSDETLDEIPAHVTVSAADPDTIHVEIEVDAKGLTFTRQSGSSVQQLTFVTLLEDAGGNFIEGKQAVMDLALSAPTLADMEAKGIKASTSFSAPKGVYRIREIVREAAQNRMAVSNTQVEIR
jgi:VWFA-related protein